MNKEELYQSVVGLYKKTGQGISVSLTQNLIDSRIIDELVSEGKLKIVTVKSNYLPDDNWICLTDVYCSEEHNDLSSLAFIRVYLKIDDIGWGLKLKDVMSNRKFMKEYQIWFDKNKELLNKIENL